jgi:membrane protein DedA with SNARE-associated domain
VLSHFFDALPHLIAVHGYWLLALLVGFECVGIPVPGETALIAAAIYAGKTHHLSIALIIAVTTASAVVGASISFWLGRNLGYGLVLRHGRYVHVTENKLKVGQLLFLWHGGKVVFVSRFIAILRGLTAFLAGMNRMPWRRFQLFNVAGAVGWPTLYGLAAYSFGHHVHRLMGPLGLGALALAIVALTYLFIFLRSHHARLQAEAERVFPGSLALHRAA